MSENLFETQYDLTKKSKFVQFYESKKFLIYSFIAITIIAIVSYTYYQSTKENKKVFLSENYIQAKVYLEDGKKKEAIKILKDIIFSNDSTYSTLSFFMILNEKLIIDRDEISKLFDHLLKNNKFDKEIRNLLVYKKILYKSDYIEESQLLEEASYLLKTDKSIWRGHALLLIGDFYFSKNEFIKAKDFYLKVLSTENLLPELYNHAKLQLTYIADD